jgi:hypothetical protein
MENLKIGITLALSSNNESIWTNGIKQNVLMLSHLLKNSDKNYEVCILNTIDVDFTEKPSYLNDLDIYFFNDKFMEMDLIILMGAQVQETYLKKFRKNGDKKVVSYKCGNNYVIAMEEIIFKGDDIGGVYEQEIDELWYIPQQDEVNKGFYPILHKTNAIIVPFIWHQKFIHESVVNIHNGFKKGNYKKDWMYDSKKEKKIIGIMEPNINIVKFGLLPAMLVEECYRGEIGKKYIEDLRITNTQKIKDNKKFISYIKTFDLFKDKKLSAESRYQTAFMLTQHLDVVVSHQILNPLNYLYLDVAYMGYPILHNAELCKDLGYYYEGSDLLKGAKVLGEILLNHDKNIDEYNERNNVVLNRYHADNKILVKIYDMLIENLWKEGNKHLKYNPKTNYYHL